jgi:PAS domain S-box-containing protein
LQTSYHDLFASAPERLIVIAADAPRFTIVDITDACLDHAHRTRAGVVGQPLDALYPSRAAGTDPALEALRASEQRYRALFHTMAEGFVLLRIVRDEAGTAIDCVLEQANPAFERHTGLAPGQVEGRTLKSLFPGAEPGWVDRFGAIERDRRAEHFLSRFGPLARWYEVRAHPNEDGQVAVVFFDVTDRRDAEDALRRSEERFAAAFANNAAAIAWTRMEGGEVLDVNDAWLAMTGVTREEVVGRSARAMWPSEADLQRFLAALRENGRVSGWEQPFARRDGQTFYAQISSQVVPVNGEPTILTTLVDITARQRAEAALRESEDRYRTLFDRMDEGFCTIELLHDETGRAIDYRFLTANPAFEHQTGFVDPVGRRMREFLPDLEQAWFDAYAQVARTGESQRFESEVAAQRRFYEVYAFRIGQPEAHRVAVLFSDVTRRRSIEAALRESEERSTFALETSHTGAWDLDLETHASQRGREHDRIFGYPEGAGDWTHERALEHVLPEDRPAFDAAFRQAARTRGDWNAECRVRRADDGQVRWIAVAGRHRTDDAAGGRRMSGIVQDITERKQAQIELAEREALLTTLTGHARVGMSMVRADHRYLFTNAAYAEILGLPTKDLAGRRVADVMGHVYETQIRPRLERAFAGERVSYELEIVQREGWTGPRVYAVTYDPPVATPHGPCVIGVKVEITERKRAEQELRDLTALLERHVADRTAELATARDAARSASRAKSAFLANMSHEIRTPMNAIIGLTHLLSRELREPRQRERLGKVDEAARHLLQIINDILDLSKIEAGKMVLEDIEFSLDAVLSGACDMVRERATAKGLELVLDTDHLPDRLRGDPTRLSQALINLLSNATKFTEHGWIRLRGERLSVDPADGTVHARFEVHDTGPGIPAERLPTLFDAFEQADTSTTRRHGGTGLGLALTRDIATLMGGEAGVESTPGQGSTFWFTVRLGRPEEESPRNGPVSLQDLHALVVDDLPEALAPIVDRLVGFRMTATGVDGCASALKACDAAIDGGRPFDVLLVDWLMAPVDGIETLRRVRARLGTPVPSILVTAFDDPVMGTRAREAGFDAVLVKPVTASALLDTLMQVLRTPPVPEVGQGVGSTDAVDESEWAVRRLHEGRQVLLVEDNPVNQEVAGELLRNLGLVVEVADCGETAVVRALSQHFDLILMDVQMPGMDGLDATRAIRSRERRRTPIVAMTANAFVEDRVACLEAGMDDHLGKPVDPKALNAALLAWLPHPPRSHLDEPDGPDAGASPGTPRPPLPERLARIPGFEADLALRNAGGSAAVLSRVLGRFVQTYGDGMPALVTAAQADDHRTCQAIAHSLRGACATIGATRLAGELERLEQRGAEVSREQCLAQVQRIVADLARFVEGLRTELVE